MKDDSALWRPFENLHQLIQSRSIPIRPDPPGEIESPMASEDKDNSSDDPRLFREATAGVIPVKGANKRLRRVIHESRVIGTEIPEEEETTKCLKLLVEHGQGFMVSQTAEYMEGRASGVGPDIPERLHQGQFSIQAHVDLHGLGVEEAREIFETFLKESVQTGKHAVAIVHGRGLSSPALPVLKTKVRQWLASDPWRKWIIAFSSARACDGGAGATYILLRDHPVNRRRRKKRSLYNRKNSDSPGFSPKKTA